MKSENGMQNRIVNLLKFYLCNSTYGSNPIELNSPDYIIEKYEHFTGLSYSNIKKAIDEKYLKPNVRNGYKKYCEKWKFNLNLNLFYFLHHFSNRYYFSSELCKDATKAKNPNCIKVLFIELISDDFDSIREDNVNGIHFTFNEKVIAPYIAHNQDFFNRVEGLTILIK